MTTRRPCSALAAGLFAVATLSFGQPAVAQDAEPTAEEIAKRMQALYNDTADFKAKFKQTYTDIAAGEAKKSFGRVYFKREGKMRWDYYEKNADGKQSQSKVLVADGDAFWIYEVKFKQVFKECLKDSKLPASLEFLMGGGNLGKSFDITKKTSTTKGTHVLELLPKEPTPQYQKLQFVVDAKTYLVLKTTIFDPYGNTNEIVFANVKLNQNLPDKGFSFQPPKDARLLTPKKTCPTSP
ncbi:MAG: outer membrane lipoprotein carrier protein LolA [Myxococcota bacterium]